MDEFMTVLLDRDRPYPFELIEPVEPESQTSTPSVVEVRAYPDDAAAWAISVDPGAQTAAVLGLLDLVRLSAAGRVDALVGFERLIAWATAGQMRVLAAMTDQSPATAAGATRAEVLRARLDRDWVREDARAALGESDHGARARLYEARELVHHLPATLHALQTGRIGARHAAAITDTTRDLDPDAARQVQDAVLPDPNARPVDVVMPVMASLRRRLRRAVCRVDPRGAEQKAATAAEDRDVWVMPGENAMSFLGAPLPAEGAETVYAAVSAKADRDREPDDPRTKAQRRADALVNLCTDYLNGPTKIEMDPSTGPGAAVPLYHRLRPAVNVCVALSTLLGLDDQPGQLDGYGPIPATIARRIAADPTGTWRRLVTDPTGHLVDHGRTTYRPPADLGRHVIARDRTCRYPGCHRAADKSDLHHIHPWSTGGETNADNLVALCERHHYLIHDAGWQLERDADGTYRWTTPTGHRHTTRPDPYPIDHTHDTRNVKIKIDTKTRGTSRPV